MKIQSVYDEEFRAYGAVVTGLEETCREILGVLASTPVPEKGIVYVAEDPALQELPAAVEVSEHLYGGMPVQLGFCNGHNTRLNCLEYHRDSECNLGTRDLVLLVARRDEMENGMLDTARVKAFRVPAGVLVEIFSTTLHYAPCHTDPAGGFQMLVVLPQGTNLEKPMIPVRTDEDRLLFAANKWLLAHPDSEEASRGAAVRLRGENIDIADLI